MSIETGGPAFPHHGPSDLKVGMTLRDYFAAKAMDGTIASCKEDETIEPEMLAKWCYQVADAMLKVRKATTP